MVRPLVEAIEEKVISILCDEVGISRDCIKPESKLLDDFGLDSLDTADLTLSLEREFDVDIPPELEAKMMSTVKSVVDAVQQVLLERSL